MLAIDVLKRKRLSFYEILELGFGVFKKSALPIILIGLLMRMPSYALSWFGIVAEPTDNPQTVKILQILLVVAVRLIGSIFSCLAMMAIALIVEKTFLNEPMGFLEAFKRAFPKWFGGIGTGLLALVIVLGYTLLLVVPGIIWGVYYLFVIYIVALRNKTGKAALEYSQSLVSGHWWDVFVVYLGISIVLGVVGGVISALFKWLPLNLFTSLISFSLQTIIGSFLTVSITILFLNLDFVKGPNDTSLSST
jgi:hypothetical protein